MNFDYDVFDLKSYDYSLDESLIAQSPAQKRDQSRLMIVDRKGQKEPLEEVFHNIVNYFQKGDVLVRNNTKVIPARLFGTKESTNAKVEVLLLKEHSKDCWECLCGNAKVIKVDSEIVFGQNNELKARCLEIKDEGIRILKFEYENNFLETLDKVGVMPLPPYIKSQLGENSRYQTVYAKILGSAAAPTAGFHFTEEVFKALEDKGVIVCDVTLHVGLGTFRPVKTDNIKDHKMHSEYYEMSKETADILNKAKKENRRIIAVGTTSCRTLETVIHEYGQFKECHGDTSIFIYPGFEFKAIDGLVTNFHLPKSTLMMLVSALSTRENILKAYEKAQKDGFRFFSFGDCMFII